MTGPAAVYLLHLRRRRSERRAAFALYAGALVVGLCCGWALASLRGSR